LIEWFLNRKLPPPSSDEGTSLVHQTSMLQLILLVLSAKDVNLDGLPTDPADRKRIIS